MKDFDTEKPSDPMIYAIDRIEFLARLQGSNLQTSALLSARVSEAQDKISKLEAEISREAEKADTAIANLAQVKAVAETFDNRNSQLVRSLSEASAKIRTLETELDSARKRELTFTSVMAIAGAAKAGKATLAKLCADYFGLSVAEVKRRMGPK